MNTPTNRLKIAAIIATKGRTDVIKRLIEWLHRQTIQPEILLIAACEPADTAGIEQVDPRVKIVLSPPGLTRQRNAAIAALPPSIDIVVFFDDDFIPSRYWFERVLDIFEDCPDIAAVTGRVLADGIKTEGIGWDMGVEIVAQSDAPPLNPAYAIQENFSPYGCNMAFRRSAIAGMKFDERLVLYGWQEDTDFGARAANNGRIVWSDALWGVHLGIKRGRVPGCKLGYSQIVNPRYLVSKGTMSPQKAIVLATRNLVANIVRSLRPEPFIDRAGRLRGNLLGLWDILTGRWYPERAAEL